MIDRHGDRGDRVAPHAGAWIETVRRAAHDLAASESPLTQGRGLKPLCDELTIDRLPVAPHAGAWIETAMPMPSGSHRAVAPHAGAWIETIRTTARHCCMLRRPSRGAWIETTTRSRELDRSA